MRQKLLLSFAIVLICESSLLAQDKYGFSQFTHETWDFVKQPTRWRGNDWLTLGLITAGTALVMPVDEPIRTSVLRGNGRYYHTVPMEFGRIWGEFYMSPVVVGGFALHGWLAHNASSKKVAFEVLQAVVYADALTEILKVAIGRARPYENEGAFSFHPFKVTDVGFNSLPGGHNTNGWAMSTVLSRNAHSTILKILAYVPATFTFVSRVYQDKHWASDDFSGAAIGIVVGTWVVNLHEKKASALSVTAINPLTVSLSF